jgi:hypothetical protein
LQHDIEYSCPKLAVESRELQQQLMSAPESLQWDPEVISQAPPLLDWDWKLELRDSCCWNNFVSTAAGASPAWSSWDFMPVSFEYLMRSERPEAGEKSTLQDVGIW